MDRNFFRQLAASGLRMPIGADLVLNEKDAPEAIRLDGLALGRVIEEAATRYETPLAFPLMDLRLEKADLLGRLNIPDAEVDTFHFSEAPFGELIGSIAANPDAPFGPRNHAHFDAIRYIAASTALVPVGMAIGPFSLMTKLMADPITAIAMAGMGIQGDEDPSVLLAERCLGLAEATVARSLRAQIQAGAKAIIVCEPAANVVYLSPKQIDKGADIFERFVMQPNVRLKAILAGSGVDLIFHNCGQLNNMFVREFATRLDPAVLSLGSSRKLWEDAALVPDRVVLFGNLPTKSFYSDAEMPLEKVEALTRELAVNMKKTGHAFILGSECDVLSVPEAHAAISKKVEAMLCCDRVPAVRI